MMARGKYRIADETEQHVEVRQIRAEDEEPKERAFLFGGRRRFRFRCEEFSRERAGEAVREVVHVQSIKNKSASRFANASTSGSARLVRMMTAK